MTHLITKLATAAAISLALATPGIAANPAVKARQALMQLYVFNISQLGGMAKGAIEYDSAAASAAANNLLAAATMKNSAMWPPGTDNEAMFGETRALPAIWTTFPAIAENGKALVAAATAMSEAAGTDLASLQAAMGPLGGACSSCHKKYREPK